MEPIVPDWFDAYFDALFVEAAYYPAGVARRLNIDNQTVMGAVLRGELLGTRSAARPGAPTFVIQRDDVRRWMLENLEINRPS